MFNLLRRNWFLLALATLFAVGFFAWQPLMPLAQQAWLRSVMIAVAMFLMALPLEGSAVINALRRPWATLLAVFVTFGLLPLVAWGVSPLLTREFAAGLLVAAVTPCTMASATVWTRKAGGNDSAATVATVVTNLVCFLITPAWMYAMMGVTQKMSITDFAEMVVKLLVTVVVPVVAAQLLRLHGSIAAWSTRHKVSLSIGSQVCILFMVAIGAVHTGEQLSQTSLGANTVLQLTIMVGAVLFVHITSFWIGLGLARVLGMPWGDQLAVGFAGSQKTLMVGMEMSIGIAASVLPMVTYHIGQLFIDTLLADGLRRKSPEARPGPVAAKADHCAADREPSGEPPMG